MPRGKMTGRGRNRTRSRLALIRERHRRLRNEPEPVGKRMGSWFLRGVEDPAARSFMRAFGASATTLPSVDLEETRRVGLALWGSRRRGERELERFLADLGLQLPDWNMLAERSPWTLLERMRDFEQRTGRSFSDVGFRFVTQNDVERNRIIKKMKKTG